MSERLTARSPRRRGLGRNASQTGPDCKTQLKGLSDHYPPERAGGSLRNDRGRMLLAFAALLLLAIWHYTVYLPSAGLNDVSGGMIRLDASEGIISDVLLLKLEGLRAKWDVAGFTLAIAASPRYTGGKEWVQKVYGFGEANTKGGKVDEQTMWGIASNSKLFNALSIGLLIDRRTPLPGGSGAVLQYSTKVRDVLPWWALQDEYTSEHITVLDLLSMRSGLPSHDFHHEKTPPRDGLPKLRYLRPSAEIRETFQYCNQHYFTLAEIVHAVSGSSLVDFVQTEILGPLDMSATTFNSTEAAETGHRSEAYLRHDRNWKACASWTGGAGALPDGCLGRRAPFGWWTDGDGVDEAGAGAMVMSGQDMTKWIRELLEPEHLPPALVERMGEPIVVMPDFFGIPASHSHSATSVWTYGMAQMRFTYRDHTVLMHTGGLPGSYSILIRLPDLGVGLMAAVNTDEVGPHFMRLVALTVVDHLLGVPERDWESQIMPAVWQGGKWTERPASPEAPLPRRLGRYDNPAYGRLSFTPLGQSTDGHAVAAALRDLQVPLDVNRTTTQIAHLDNKAFINALALTHFDGQLWNWTTLIMYDTPHGRKASSTSGTGSAIVNEEGIGMFGNYWIAGDGVEVRHAHKSATRQEAEVWYDAMK